MKEEMEIEEEGQLVNIQKINEHSGERPIAPTDGIVGVSDISGMGDASEISGMVGVAGIASIGNLTDIDNIACISDLSDINDIGGVHSLSKIHFESDDVGTANIANAGGIKIGVNKKDYDVYISQLKDKNSKELIKNKTKLVKKNLSNRNNECISSTCEMKILDAKTNDYGFCDSAIMNEKMAFKKGNKEESNLSMCAATYAKVKANDETGDEILMNNATMGNVTKNGKNYILQNKYYPTVSYERAHANGEEVHNNYAYVDFCNEEEGKNYDEKNIPIVTDLNVHLKNDPLLGCDAADMNDDTIDIDGDGDTFDIASEGGGRSRCSTLRGRSGDWEKIADRGRSGDVYNAPFDNSSLTNSSILYHMKNKECEASKPIDGVDVSFDDISLMNESEFVKNAYGLLNNAQLANKLSTFCNIVQEEEETNGENGNEDGEILHDGEAPHDGASKQSNEDELPFEEQLHVGEKIERKRRKLNGIIPFSDNKVKKVSDPDEESVGVESNKHFLCNIDEGMNSCKNYDRTDINTNVCNSSREERNVFYGGSSLHEESNFRVVQDPQGEVVGNKFDYAFHHDGDKVDVPFTSNTSTRKINRRCGKRSRFNTSRNDEANISLKSLCNDSNGNDLSAVSGISDRVKEEDTNDDTGNLMSSLVGNCLASGNTRKREKLQSTGIQETYSKRPQRNAAKKCITLWSEEFKRRSEKGNASLHERADGKKEEKTLKRREKRDAKSELGRNETGRNEMGRNEMGRSEMDRIDLAREQEENMTKGGSSTTNAGDDSNNLEQNRDDKEKPQNVLKTGETVTEVVGEAGREGGGDGKNIPILFDDTMDEREMFKYLDLLRHLPSKKGGAQYKLHKAILTEEMVKRAKKFPLVQGVYFDRYQQRWSVNWNEDGKRVAKYFPIKLFGFDYARRLAIYCKNYQKIPEEALIFEQAYRANQQNNRMKSESTDGGNGNGRGKRGNRRGIKKRNILKGANSDREHGGKVPLKKRRYSASAGKDNFVGNSGISGIGSGSNGNSSCGSGIVTHENVGNKGDAGCTTEDMSLQGGGYHPLYSNYTRNRNDNLDSGIITNSMPHQSNMNKSDSFSKKLLFDKEKEVFFVNKGNIPIDNSGEKGTLESTLLNEENRLYTRGDMDYEESTLQRVNGSNRSGDLGTKCLESGLKNSPPLDMIEASLKQGNTVEANLVDILAKKRVLRRNDDDKEEVEESELRQEDGNNLPILSATKGANSCGDGVGDGCDGDANGDDYGDDDDVEKKGKRKNFQKKNLVCTSTGTSSCFKSSVSCMSSTSSSYKNVENLSSNGTYCYNKNGSFGTMKDGVKREKSDSSNVPLKYHYAEGGGSLHNTDQEKLGALEEVNDSSFMGVDGTNEDKSEFPLICPDGILDQSESDNSKLEDIRIIKKYRDIVNNLATLNNMRNSTNDGVTNKKENGKKTPEENGDDINSRIVGVHYDRKQYRWKATWYTSHGRRCAKYYPIKQYGYLQAKRMAIECRKAYNMYKRQKKNPEGGNCGGGNGGISGGGSCGSGGVGAGGNDNDSSISSNGDLDFENTIFPREYYITLFENDEKKDGYYWDNRRGKKSTGKKTPFLDNNEKQRRHYNEAMKKINNNNNNKQKDMMGVVGMSENCIFSEGNNDIEMSNMSRAIKEEDSEHFLGGVNKPFITAPACASVAARTSVAACSSTSVSGSVSAPGERAAINISTDCQGNCAGICPKLSNFSSENEQHGNETHPCECENGGNCSSTCAAKNPSSLLSLYYLSENILKFQKGTIKCILQDLRDNCLSNLAYDLKNITFQEYYMAIHYLNRYVDDSNCYDDIFFLLKILAKHLEIRKIPSLYNEEEQKELLNSLTAITKQMRSSYSYLAHNNMQNANEGGDRFSSLIFQ
ncbi:transcription factor with AP2 domain(s), putative [Plasmodium ovale]|uniref:Transcription factor with AP2 domain(S), putative n=1 Tax=Plasmodium ovale TaxID=36330 RepID=A0A1D3U8P0_PLAOA|nr:transcription factor with AP2 domain(s), putative [Plasmodium ovale]